MLVFHYWEGLSVLTICLLITLQDVVFTVLFLLYRIAFLLNYWCLSIFWRKRNLFFCCFSITYSNLWWWTTFWSKDINILTLLSNRFWVNNLFFHILEIFNNLWTWKTWWLSQLLFISKVETWLNLFFMKRIRKIKLSLFLHVLINVDCFIQPDSFFLTIILNCLFSFSKSWNL